MLRFYEEGKVCHIVIDASFEYDDMPRLSALFREEYSEWIVEFTNIHSLDASIIGLLYHEIFVENKNIILQAHTERLSRYLHKLGFRVHSFVQQKECVVDAKSIELVLIGGSADSSEKIIKIVKNCSFENLSLIVVQHQQADGIRAFDTILQPFTKHKVSYAKDFQKIEKEHIYLAPNNKHLLVEDGHFVLSNDVKYNFTRPSISRSYASFAHYYKKTLLVIQECGYVNDGVDSLETLKSNGSSIIIQNKDECTGESVSMAIQAEEEKLHNYLFTSQKMVEYISFLDKNHDDTGYINYLLEQIKQKYEYDFRDYHHEMVRRRLEAFMIKNRIKSMKNCVGFILFNKSKFKNFFLELSINVTEFFRNPKIYNDLQVILTSAYKNRKNLKVWSAGCSSGKEAVSIAILLESLQKLEKSIIYATDFNQTVIEEAKNGLYTLQAYEKAEENLQESGLILSMDYYFSKNRQYVTIQEFIKEKILYFEHNLLTDSSFNEFDIIVCSNVMIYFEETSQKKVFQLFYDSLKFGAYLILGERELIHKDFSSKFQKYKNTIPIYKKIR